MKQSTKNVAEGKFHQAKGKVKEASGVILGNQKLEDEGKIEKINGKIQEKIGDIEKVVDK